MIVLKTSRLMVKIILYHAWGNFGLLHEWLSGQVEEGKHERKEHDGKKQWIERSHFGHDPICNYARFSVLQCFGTASMNGGLIR